MPNEQIEMIERLTRPIVGIENRAPQEAFDIMVDRIRAAYASHPDTGQGMREALELARSYIVPGRNGNEVRAAIDAALGEGE